MAQIIPMPKDRTSKEKRRVAVKPQRVRLPGLTMDSVPQIGSVLSYRGVHILAQLNKDGTQLKGTHYAILLVGGSQPLWGVWTIAGKFQRFFGSKQEIADAYPAHVWRRHPARWLFEDLAPQDTIERKNYMLTKYEE